MHWRRVCAHKSETPKSTNLELSVMVGSMRLAIRVEWHTRSVFLSSMSASEQALLRSQSGPGAGAQLSAVFICIYPILSGKRRSPNLQEAGGRVAVNVMVRTWTLQHLTPEMDAASKLWWMGCLCLVAPHHFCAALRWVSHGGKGQRRGGTRPSSTTQGEDLSRTGRSSSTGSVGRVGG